VIDVCGLAELEEGAPRIVVHGRREIAVARWGERVYAVRNICPHQSQSFACGTVRARLHGAGAGSVTVDEDDPVIRCPWHTWEFRLLDGTCTTDRQLRVRTYPVEIRDGRVLIELGDAT
jgi:nitrite reductase/ring-hydroxylating ferredoxin subunit